MATLEEITALGEDVDYERRAGRGQRGLFWARERLAAAVRAATDDVVNEACVLRGEAGARARLEWNKRLEER